MTNLKPSAIIMGLSRCSAVGSAHGLGPWCRRFESYHLDHKKDLLFRVGRFYFVGEMMIRTTSRLVANEVRLSSEAVGSLFTNGARSHPIIQPWYGVFLSKSQAWYIIRRTSVYHHRRCISSRLGVYFCDLMIYNAVALVIYKTPFWWYTRLCRDLVMRFA